MNGDEILFWKNKYDGEEILYNTGVEEELRDKFQKYNYVTKYDLIKIIEWKFQGRLIGRQKIIRRLLDNIDESFIKEVSKLAFNFKDDEIRLKLFSCIKGIGNAVTSVVLTFYDPQNYGILDIHTWRELFGKEPKDVFSNNYHALKFFSKLREISSKESFPCRDVEKAIFKKNFDESKMR
jgi:hypothetical protein